MLASKCSSCNFSFKQRKVYKPPFREGKGVCAGFTGGASPSPTVGEWSLCADGSSCGNGVRARTGVPRFLFFQIFLTEFREIGGFPRFIIAREALILRGAVVGEVIPFREDLADGLQIFIAELMAGRNEMPFVPLVPIVDHDDLLAPRAIGERIGDLLHALKDAAEIFGADVPAFFLIKRIAAERAPAFRMSGRGVGKAGRGRNEAHGILREPLTIKLALLLDDIVLVIVIVDGGAVARVITESEIESVLHGVVRGFLRQLRIAGREDHAVKAVRAAIIAASVEGRSLLFRVRKAFVRKPFGIEKEQDGLIVDLQIIVAAEIILHPERHEVFDHVLLVGRAPERSDLKHEREFHIFLIFRVKKCLVDAVSATKRLQGHGLAHVGASSVPAVNEAIDAVLDRPFDLPIADLGVFFVVITHQRRAVGKGFRKVVEALVNLCRAVFPRRVIMRRHNAVRGRGARLGNVGFEFDIIHKEILLVFIFSLLLYNTSAKVTRGMRKFADFLCKGSAVPFR